MGPVGGFAHSGRMTCGRFTVKLLMTGPYANLFLNWCPVFV